MDPRRSGTGALLSPLLSFPFLAPYPDYQKPCHYYPLIPCYQPSAGLYPSLFPQRREGERGVCRGVVGMWPAGVRECEATKRPLEKTRGREGHVQQTYVAWLRRRSGQSLVMVEGRGRSSWEPEEGKKRAEAGVRGDDPRVVGGCGSGNKRLSTKQPNFWKKVAKESQIFVPSSKGRRRKGPMDWRSFLGSIPLIATRPLHFLLLSPSFMCVGVLKRAAPHKARGTT